jgi:murein L,D-transpeptidase YcbB/YkuD
MGFVKINFHNTHSVYLHDTPSKSLIRRNLRTYSSGCVRVQSVTQLVAWLLQPNAGTFPRSRRSTKRASART